MTSKFTHYDLELVQPDFGSTITDLIIDLDYLRSKKLGGSTHPKVFFQLKRIFHTLESIGSARIEGNNTTITDFIENNTENSEIINENILEIQNIEKSMSFIDDNIESIDIKKLFTSELHKHIVNGLTPPPYGEGDKTPGLYRNYNIGISNSTHKPPDPFLIDGYMDGLFNFISDNHSSKYDLLKTAIAHHRFVWIHPFANGNGRTVRLFTYAMLVKQGFNVNLGRIVNPTAIFCNDRDLYYKYLSKADTGTKKGILEWSEYVLSGLKTEIEKFYSKNPEQSDDFPRIINTKNTLRLKKMLDNVNVIFGGEINENECYIAPTIIDEPNLNSNVMQDEIFGPILPILSYKTESDIESIIWNYEKPLSLYVFSNKKSFVNQIINKYSFGGGVVNDTLIHFGNDKLPFGGVGTSGMGAYHGKLGFDTFSHNKSIIKRGNWIDPPVRYAPYKNKLSLIKKLFKYFT